jgi:hypothetical protein
VTARVVADDVAISCGRLDVELEQDPKSQTVPRRMVAQGQVRASEHDQVMWADRLEATFRPQDPEEAEDPDVVPPAEEPGRPRVAVDTVTARGDVQLRLADGQRIFADEFVADAINETADLSGEHVVVLDGQYLIDHGHGVRLRVDRNSGRVNWDGPGQFRFFSKTITDDGLQRIDRPRIDEDRQRPQVKARWNDALRYDATVNDGAGSLELHGDVEALTRLTTRQRNALEGQSVTLHFTENPEATPPADGQEAPPADVDPVIGSAGKRQISRLIARGEAKLENRTWSTDDRREEPRIFYVAGDSVDYDDLAVSARIDGAGTLLIRDLRPPGANPAGPDAEAPFVQQPAAGHGPRQRADLAQGSRRAGGLADRRRGRGGDRADRAA